MLIAFATILYGVFNTSFVKDQKKYNDFSDSWYYGTEEVNLKEIYKYREVTKNIPKLERDTELFFIVKSINTNVYIGNELVYTYEDYDKKLFGKTPGTYFIKIDVPREDSGKQIKLRMDNAYHDTAGRIKEVYIGDASEVILDFVLNHLLGTIVAAMIFFVGVALVIVFVPLKIKRKIGLKMVYLGLFAMAIGLFMVSDTKLLQLVNGNDYLYHMIAEISMLLIAIPLMLFLDRAYPKSCHRSSISIMCILSILNFIVNYSFHMLGISDYHETIKLTHTTYILCILYVLFVCIKSFINGTKKEKQHTIGFITFCLFALIDILMIYFGAMVETSFFTRFGVLIFLCFEGVQFATEYIKQYREQAKTEFLSKLAYHDGLTELLNRTSFMEDMERLKNIKSGLIAVFDVNNLKKVNDTQGHTEGDELIIRVSSALKTYLSTLGKCYRIGGDEFVFISLDNTLEDKFNSACKQITNELNQYNRRGSKYITSVAIGYSMIDEETSIDKAFEIADSNMYENKIKIKEKQKKLK